MQEPRHERLVREARRYEWRMRLVFAVLGAGVGFMVGYIVGVVTSL